MSNFGINVRATRRQVLVGSAAVGAATALPRDAFAASFHNFAHGAFDITVVSDGFITLPPEILLPDAEVDERADFLKRLGGGEKGAAVQANIPLIRHGNDLILVDNGSGTNFQPTAGKLANNLRTFGVSPEQITKVVFTHVHPDHSGATTTIDGKVLYPNAQYYVSQTEWDFWTDKEFEAKRPSALHGFAKGAQRDLLAVEDRLTRMKAGDEIVPGMSVVDTPGHTPGHISIELEGRDNLLITGDACTNDTIFFARPDWHFGFDTDMEVALASRQKLLDRAASEKLKLLGYHWTYPGVGFAERRGGAYDFVST
ncbi:metallo-beta-lactamase superfamily protein (plasmid) [Sinorhizobium americanum CCGM7]|uniref:MBL fold metallo-hydrolase n=1 Tax=Sinorhizobium americanum TaxID=194963 RepID=UPI0004D34145|nr:MBL fold metallo-hydrolase [Sinorhizobium americanum]APG89187.1 metallo-beta-lactamase superfamily protein [Sinorhizobium americanum CCGM7]